MTVGEREAGGGGEPVLPADRGGEPVLPLPALLDALETNGYLARHEQVNERLHVVLAVPVRPHRPG